MYKKFIILCALILTLSPSILSSKTKGSPADIKPDSREATVSEITRLSVRPATLRLYPGGSMQLVATAYDSSGNKIIVKPEWKIQSEIPMLGEFDKTEGQKVIFSALNSGSGSIIAVYNNIEAEIHVEVYKRKGH